MRWRKRCKRSQFKRKSPHQYHRVYKTTCYSVLGWVYSRTVAQCNGQAAPQTQTHQSVQQNPISQKPRPPSNTNNKSSTPQSNTPNTPTPYTQCSSTRVVLTAATTMPSSQTVKIGTGLMIAQSERSVGMRWGSMAILIGWWVGLMRICCFIGMWGLSRTVIRIGLRCHKSWWKRWDRINKRYSNQGHRNPLVLRNVYNKSSTGSW